MNTFNTCTQYSVQRLINVSCLCGVRNPGGLTAVCPDCRPQVTLADDQSDNLHRAIGRAHGDFCTPTAASGPPHSEIPDTTARRQVRFALKPCFRPKAWPLGIPHHHPAEIPARSALSRFLSPNADVGRTFNFIVSLPLCLTQSVSLRHLAGRRHMGPFTGPDYSVLSLFSVSLARLVFIQGQQR